MSWDCSSNYSPSPFGNLTDSIYNGVDNKTSAPILPPGVWDWNNEPNAANWRNVRDNCGKFNFLVSDTTKKQFGWQFIRNKYDADISIAFGYFFYSSGTDIVNLGPNGKLHTLDNRKTLNFDQDKKSGGDILAYRESWSLNYYLSHGNNLLLVGACAYDDPFATSSSTKHYYMTSTVHLSDGSDFAYVRDASRAAIDLGNGNQGRTDTISSGDKNDTLVIAGNAHDIRVFGGGGSDTVFWTGISRIKQSSTWLGLNFFGTGGWGDALWDPDDSKVDRLVLDIPPSTPLRKYGDTPTKYSFLVHCSSSYVIDEPTKTDVYARYCVTCGEHAGDKRKTMIFEYQTDSVHTGYFYVTDFNVLQFGLDKDAKVFDIDDVNCTLKNSIKPVVTLPSIPTKYCKDEIFNGAKSVGGNKLPSSPSPGKEDESSSVRKFSFVQIIFTVFVFFFWEC